MTKPKYTEKLLVYCGESTTQKQADEVKKELSKELKIKSQDIIILKGIDKIEFINIKNQENGKENRDNKE